mmetsp:Transcript_36002/g.112567  ORF Transcript_36002/g.112567 Transcript_36002/m.112567 type:complete len:299 (+) Transcript_36002:1625-2521(+)
MRGFWRLAGRWRSSRTAQVHVALLDEVADPSCRLFPLHDPPQNARVLHEQLASLHAWKNFSFSGRACWTREDLLGISFDHRETLHNRISVGADLDLTSVRHPDQVRIVVSSCRFILILRQRCRRGGTEDLAITAFVQQQQHGVHRLAVSLHQNIVSRPVKSLASVHSLFHLTFADGDSFPKIRQGPFFHHDLLPQCLLHFGRHLPPAQSVIELLAELLELEVRCCQQLSLVLIVTLWLVVDHGRGIRNKQLVLQRLNVSTVLCEVDKPIDVVHHVHELGRGHLRVLALVPRLSDHEGQ